MENQSNRETREFQAYPMYLQHRAHSGPPSNMQDSLVPGASSTGRHGLPSNLPPIHFPPPHAAFSPVVTNFNNTPLNNYYYYHNYVQNLGSDLIIPSNSWSQPSQLSYIQNAFYSTESLNSLTVYNAEQLLRKDKMWRNENLKKAYEQYNLQNFTEAKNILDQVVQNFPHHIPSLLLYGCVSFALGDYNLSLNTNLLILTLDNSFAEAHSNMGTTYRAMNMFGKAEQCYKNALSLKPCYPDALFNLISLLKGLGRSVDALEILKQVDLIKYSLEHRRDILYYSGDLCIKMGDHKSGLMYFMEALRVISIEVSEFQSTVSIQDNDIVSEIKSHEITNIILYALSKAFQGAGKIGLAIACYYTALSIFPTPDACNNIGILLFSVGSPERVMEASEWLSYGLTLNPNHPHIYANLGNALKEQGKIVEAIFCYEKAVQLDPSFTIAFANLGNAYKDFGRFQDAIRAYEHALRLKPDFNDAFCNMVHTKMFICDWDERDELFQKVRMILDKEFQQPFKLETPLPPVLPFHTFTYPLSVKQIKEISKRNSIKTKQRADTMGLARNFTKINFKNSKRIRIGYVSSDFCNHPSAHLISSVFGYHDRSRFEVHCYSLVASDNSIYRKKIEAEVEFFKDISPLSNENIIETVQTDEIDVLINMNGYTKGARNEIFAARCSPVQISYMGFAGSVGSDWIDYTVIDEIAYPPQYSVFDDGKGLFHEKVIYMPHSYLVNDHKQSYREGVLELDGKILSFDETENLRHLKRESIFPFLGKDVTIFANFNQLYKVCHTLNYFEIDPKILQSWINILLRCQKSILWLLKFPAEGEYNLLKFSKIYLHNMNIDEKSKEDVIRRIIFTDVAQKEEHIARGMVADLFLDTSECNAHTTAADILWAGTPLLTFPKYKMASRVAAGMVYTAGLGKFLVANSYEEYENLAVKYGSEKTYLDEFRSYLVKSRENSRLYDTKRWTKNFEKALEKAFLNSTSGLPAASFKVEDEEDEPERESLEDNLIIGDKRVLNSIPSTFFKDYELMKDGDCILD